MIEGIIVSVKSGSSVTGIYSLKMLQELPKCGYIVHMRDMHGVIGIGRSIANSKMVREE